MIKTKSVGQPQKRRTMMDLESIYTGTAKTNPAVLKAQANKARTDSIVAAYKKNTDLAKTNLSKAKKK